MDAASLLLTLCLMCSTAFRVTWASNPRASSHPKVLMVSYDGFRYSYFGQHGPTPAFDSILESGVYVPELKNVFPTKTFPNHISLVTGLYPGFHGGLSNSIYDKDKHEVINMFRNGEDYVTKNPGVLPLWIVNEMAGEGRYSGVSMWPGETFGFGPNKLHPKYALSYNTSVPWETRVDIALSWFVNDTAPANFVAFYIEEPDEHGHNYGPDSPEVDEVVHKLDNLTAYIRNGLEKMGLWDEVNVIFTADHGMSAVNGTHILNVTEYVDVSKVNVTSTSPVLFYYVREGEEAVVEQQLRNASENLKFELYKRDEWPERWHLGSMDHLPDYMAIAPVGFAFEEAFWLGAWNNRSHAEMYGIHGFDNEMSDMHAFVIAHGPRFKSGFKLDTSSATAAEHEQSQMMNLDLYPMVCNILGIEAPANNGSFARAEALLDPASEIPGKQDEHTAHVLLPAFIIFLGLSVCGALGFMIWRRRKGYQLEEGTATSTGRVESSDRTGDREEEQHLLVPPPFLTATEEV